MTTYHIGIDLHKSVAQICVLDGDGEIREERRWQLPDKAAGAELVSWLESFREGRFAVEAIGCNRWFVRACQESGLDLLVVASWELDLKKAGKKTDRRDARQIARKLHLGDLDRYARTYFASDIEYGQRKLLRVRHNLIQRRTSLAAQIRGVLNSYLERPPTGSLYAKRSVEWLRQLALPTEDEQFALEMLVEELVSVDGRIEALGRRIRQRALEDVDAKHLAKELPQVGPQTALTLRAELGDATRFEGARQAASYAGLVPRVAASADKAHHGRLTRRGNAELRWIVGQWAVRLITFDERAKAWAKPMLARMNKNKVRSALARRLIVGVWALLARGEVFSLERCLGQQRAA